MVRRYMTPEQRALWKDIVYGIQTVDATNAKMFAEILGILKTYPPTELTDLDYQAISRSVEDVVRQYYGISRDTAPKSLMYENITGIMEGTVEGVYKRAYEELRDSVIAGAGQATWDEVAMNVKFMPIHDRSDLKQFMDLYDKATIDRARLLRAQSLDPNRRWVPRERWNTKQGYRLSDRLWKMGVETRQTIDDVIRAGMKEGKDALKIAQDLERYLNDSAKSMTLYDKSGRVVHRMNMTKAPRNGWGNVSARRLARTEITRMHGVATIEAAKKIPGIKGIRWALSNRHMKQDICDELSQRDGDGLGPGVYAVDNVPNYPAHPNCLCCLIHAHIPRQQFVDEIVRKYAPQKQEAA